MARGSSRWSVLRLAVLATVLASGAVGDQTLQTTGFTTCQAGGTVVVNKADISYDNDNQTVVFDVSGTSTKVQNVTATLNVTAYGTQIYQNTFNPCEQSTFVEQLCPVPAGTFAAKGSQAIPAQYAKLVPAIAFQIPDIAAMATIELKSLDTNQSVACVQSQVSNGKTATVPAVSYVAASIAGAALIMGGVSAAIAGGSAALGGGGAGSAASMGGGLGTPSPSFTEVFGWFQGMAMNGMLSVNYPKVYRSFTKNFAFSTGIIPWTALQTSIDNFRAKTGGNLNGDSVQFLQNATLVFPDGSTQTTGENQSESILKMKRALGALGVILDRQITTSVNTSQTSGTGMLGMSGNLQTTVSGISAYVEELSVPKANTFMTVLLVISIVIGAIVVSILLVKVVLETWALFGSFPKGLAGFRQHYWGSIARAITTLILLLYGVWVLYCVFQFTNGDSWAAKALAGATLALFTGVLAFFSWRISSTARKLRRAEGDASGLYEDKDIWVKYSLFYESYRKSYWWVFVPTIVYMFAKGSVLAILDGHGQVQTIAQLVIEALMLGLLLWSRPFERRSGNVINIIVQVVRVLSVVCILVFVEEFGIAQTTQTVTGVVLIAVQSALTGILAILIAWNAIIACCKENPHRKRRKEMEKLQRDMDNLTPLDARNSLLNRPKTSGTSDTSTTFSMDKTVERKPVPARSPSPPAQYYTEVTYHTEKPPLRPPTANGNNGTGPYRPLTPNTPGTRAGDPSRDNLLLSAAPIGGLDNRQPTVPDVGGVGYGPGYGQGYGGGFPQYRSQSRGRY